MLRDNLDRRGARKGQLSAASLQLGEDTVAVARIATMSIQDLQFQPWNIKGNRRIQAMYNNAFIAALFFGFAGIVWFYFDETGFDGWIALLVGLLLIALSLWCAYKTFKIGRMIDKTVPYYRLTIGTSDGRTIDLVDDNRPVLEDIRDVVRHKMDTDDHEITGTFDLETDSVTLNRPVPSADALVAPEPVAETLPEPEPVVETVTEPEDPDPDYVAIDQVMPDPQPRTVPVDATQVSPTPDKQTG